VKLPILRVTLPRTVVVSAVGFDLIDLLLMPTRP